MEIIFLMIYLVALEVVVDPTRAGGSGGGAIELVAHGAGVAQIKHWIKNHRKWRRYCQ